MAHYQRHCHAFHALPIGGAPSISIILLVSSPPPTVWAWFFTLDLFDTFHLGLCWPHLYVRIPFALWQKVQLTFHLPLTLPMIHLTWLPSIYSFYVHNGVSPFLLGVDQLGIERLGCTFDDSFQVIERNFKRSIFSKHKHLWCCYVWIRPLW